MERADRLAFLVDGEAYFSALAASLERARRSVLVAGWDVDGRVRLPSAGQGGGSRDLRRVLGDLARRRRGLHIHVLAWDFAMIYALERQPLPVFHLAWRTHRRVHFELDGHHPIGGSHHEKVVVVDDAVAFLGGFDLALRRRDTPAHRPGDPVRSTPGGDPYPPFHDVQLAVSGPVAAALGAHVRERWSRSLGRRVRPPDVASDPWPDGVEPDARGVRVGLARTRPAWEDEPGVREVEAMYLDAIRSAERWIYLENQYLTSRAITEALIGQLRRPAGPEVVFVGPVRQTGWLEEASMGAVRAAVLKRLRDADRHGRFRAFHPYVEGPAGSGPVYVHAKLGVVDGRFATVGSANLANRSMGFDTECNAFVETDAAAGLAHRLLGEHLGADPETVAAGLARTGSLVAAIEELNGGTRRLRPLEPPVAGWAAEVASGTGLADPESPLAPPALVDLLLPDAEAPDGRRKLRIGAVVLLVALVAAWGAWRYGPLAEWLRPERIAAWMAAYRASDAALAWTTGGFTAASLLMVPLNLLVFETGVVFGPTKGLLHALVGSLASALCSYGLGRMLGRGLIRRVSGPYATAVSRMLHRHGIATVAAVRLVPVAPFTIVNLIAGASGVRLRPYLVGTAIGLAPGILVLTWFGHRVAAAVRDPGWISIGWAAGLGAVGAGLLWWVARRVRREIEASRAHEIGSGS